MEKKSVNNLFFPGHSWEEFEGKINWAYDRPDFLFSDDEKLQRQNFRSLVNAVEKVEKVYTDQVNTVEDVEKFPLYSRLLSESKIFPYSEECMKSKYQKEVPETDGIYVREAETSDNDFSSKGLLSFTIDEACKKSHLFQAQHETINKNSAFNPKRLQAKYRHSCNSLIIIDPYIFTNESILFETIEAFLPEHLTSAPFVVTIVSIREISINNKKVVINLEEKEKLLNEHNWHQKNNIKVKFEVFPSTFFINEKYRSLVHDRYILTDYMMVRLPGGVDNYKQLNPWKIVGEKNTSAHIYYPTLHGSDREGLCKEYWQQVDEVRTCIKLSDRLSSNPIFNLDKKSDYEGEAFIVDYDPVERVYHCGSCLIHNPERLSLGGRRIIIHTVLPYQHASIKYPFYCDDWV